MKRRFILLTAVISLTLLISFLVVYTTLSDPRFLLVRERNTIYYRAQIRPGKPTSSLDYTGTADPDVKDAVDKEGSWIKASQSTYLINATQNNIWSIEYGNETYYSMSAIQLPSEESNTQFTILQSAPYILGVLSLGWAVAAGLHLAMPRIFKGRKRAIPVTILTLLTLALLFSQTYAFLSEPRFLILRGSGATYYRAHKLGEKPPGELLNYTGSKDAAVRAVQEEDHWIKADKPDYLVEATQHGTRNIEVNKTYYSMDIMYSHLEEEVNFRTIDSAPYLSGGFSIVLVILGLAFAMPRAFIPCKHKSRTPDGLFKMCKKLKIMPLYRSHCKKCKYYES